MLQNLFYKFPPCTVFFHKNLYQKKMILLYEGSQTWQFHKKYMMESFMKAWYAYTKKRKVAMFIIGINWYFTITYSDIQINKNSVRSRILQLDFLVTFGKMVFEIPLLHEAHRRQPIYWKVSWNAFARAIYFLSIIS